jgi:FMNH2-dependent dimethyl sulfone monooxygenase
LTDHIRAVKNATERQRRRIRVIINPTIIARPTSEEAWRYYQAMIDHADLAAIENFAARDSAGDSQSWPQHSARGRAVGGHLHIIGSPPEVADRLAQLHHAGIDGVQITFYDYEQELAFFGSSVIPLWNKRDWICRLRLRRSKYHERSGHFPSEPTCLDYPCNRYPVLDSRWL